jgi:basic amino acid/polyamine antiporter, APA family
LSTSQPTVTLVRGLGLVAATSIVIGDLIGTGVFLKARVMVCNVGTPGMVLGVWVVGALLSLAGALTYAELAAMLPRAGGEYVFIREAYGPRWAFLYGWTRFFVANTGGLAALAAGFAIFLNTVIGGGLAADFVRLDLGVVRVALGGVQAVAIMAIVVMTLINCAAVSVGGRIASVLAAVKLTLVLGVALGAFLLAHGTWAHFAGSAARSTCDGVAAAARGGAAGFGAALLGALWAYNGWNELSYVAGEVRDPRRNLPLATIGGIGLVALFYVIANASYFYVLTPLEAGNVPASSSIAAEVVSRFLGPAAAGVIAGALAMSILGSVQVSSLVTARIPYAMASDGLFFRRLAWVSPRTHVPVGALLAQAVWSCLLVATGSFDTLTDYSMFGIVIFVALTTASVFVFRRKMPDAERPYRTWGYPIVPVLFLLVAGWLIVNTVLATPRQALVGLGLIVTGLPFYSYWAGSRVRIQGL